MIHWIVIMAGIILSWFWGDIMQYSEWLRLGGNVILQGEHEWMGRSENTEKVLGYLEIKKWDFHTCSSHKSILVYPRQGNEYQSKSIINFRIHHEIWSKLVKYAKVICFWMWNIISWQCQEWSWKKMSFGKKNRIPAGRKGRRSMWQRVIRW